MNEIIIKDEIENMIYEIRGKQVMLDRDVASLYNTSSKRINEIVKRNKERFPIDFCFRIDKNDLDNLWSQNATANISKMSRTFPYVFTEYGIIMLSGLLNSEVAVEVNKKVIKAFVKMRKYINYEKNILLNMENKLIEHNNKLLQYDDKFNKIFDMLDSKEKINHIFFEGQIYDAYSLLIDILSKAKKEITIINKETLYHSGASLKDLGKKCFGINKIEDKNYLKQLLESVN